MKLIIWKTQAERSAHIALQGQGNPLENPDYVEQETKVFRDIDMGENIEIGLDHNGKSVYTIEVSWGDFLKEVLPKLPRDFALVHETLKKVMQWILKRAEDKEMKYDFIDRDLWDVIEVKLSGYGIIEIQDRFASNGRSLRFIKITERGVLIMENLLME